MQDVMYINIGGYIWKLFEDGHLELLAPGESVPEGEVIYSDIPPEGINKAGLFSSGTSAITTILGNVGREGNEVIPKAGFQTYSLPDSTEESDTPETLVQRLSADAAITIEINDDENLEDSFVNRFENPSVDFFGTTFDIDDDWVVELALIDSTGRVFINQSMVVGGVWELPNQDLTPLAEGPFIAIASVTDFYGNRVSSTTTSVKDTLADGVSVEGDVGSDSIIDMFEAKEAHLSGEFVHVQTGAPVDLYVTDTEGTQLAFSTTLQSDGSWSLVGDLSSLAEGILTLRSETIDLAGNPAQISNTVELFLSPIITVNNDDADGVFNQYEAPIEVFYGRTLNVEDGQTVTVTITSSGGGSALVLTTIVVNQTWTIDPYDLSSLPDGTLTIVADTVNLAGQPAQAQINWRLDQTAVIDAEFVDPNTDAVYNALEAMAAALLGSVTDIEDGQSVTVKVEDSLGHEISGTGTVSGGSWSASDLDLSSASPGLLTLTIEGQDLAGNLATATATIDYDPNATVADLAVDDQDGDQDRLFNAAEVGVGITLEGLTDGIEAGQPLVITISDGVNPDVVINTVLVQGASGTGSATGAGSWQTALNGVDLSSLNDGDLSVTVEGEDLAGNPASGSDTIHKDTLVQIAVQFDGDGNLSSSEITAVSISGMATDVEAGQQVTITVSGAGASDIVFTAEVQGDGTFSSLNNATSPTYDLSAFEDGTLNVVAEVEDVAGNTASAANTVLKDTVVRIDIDTGEEGLSVFEIRYGRITDFSGTTDAEDGRTVTVSLTDGTDTRTATGIVSGGAWSVSGLSGLGLATGQSWTLSAEVEDLAGNQVLDVTPTIVQASSMLLSENNLDIDNGITDSATSLVRSVVYSTETYNSVPYRFSAVEDQNGIQNLLSNNSTTTLSVSADGQTLQLTRDSDGALILEAVLNNALAEVSLTLYDSIEQPINSIARYLALEITEYDLDPADYPVPDAGVIGSAPDVIRSEIPFIIRDGVSFALDDEYTEIEGDLSTDNIFDNDNLFEGPLIITSVSNENGVVGVTFDTPGELVGPEGTLFVYYDGTWEFEAARDQNNADSDPQFTFTYNALDADNDVDFAEVTLTLADGASGKLDPTLVELTEADIDTLPGPAVGGGDTLTILAGSDNLVPSSVAFAFASLALLEEKALTSLGDDLTYLLSPDGKMISAYSATSNELAFELLIQAVQSANGQDLDASAVFTWYRPLDHRNSEGDELQLDLLVTAVDTDGTPIDTSNATLVFLDGNDPVLSASSTVSLEEDSLSPATAEGVLALDVGSDLVRTVEFLNGPDLGDVTSNGNRVEFFVSADGQSIVGRTLFAQEVLRITLNNSGDYSADTDITYTVTQSLPIDQLNANGGDDGVLVLPFTVRVEDSDGDVSNAQLEITTQDSTAGTLTGALVEVSEKPRALGQTATDQASAQITVSANKDEIVLVDFDVASGDAVLSEGLGVSQNGQPLYWRNNGDGTLDALNQTGQSVLKITIYNHDESVGTGRTINKTVEVEVFGAIDHLDLTDNPVDELLLVIPLYMEDSDGSISNSEINITVYDGRDPVVRPGPALEVDEGQIVTGSTSESVIQGLLGSDQFKSIDLELLTAGVNSGGESVTLVRDGVNRWYGEAGSRKVFQVDLAFDGNLKFTLLDALDHTAPPLNTADINDLPLEFSYTVVDQDGDRSNAESFFVNVKDDIPAAPVYRTGLSFTEYDNFSGNLLAGDLLVSDVDLGADGGRVSSIAYKGTNYVVDQGSRVDITLTEPGYGEYGTLTVYDDGRFEVVTNAVFNINGDPFNDQLTVNVQDNDGDWSSSDLTFRVIDQQGSFTLTPLETQEDTPVSLILTGNTGDTDNNEVIISFLIAESSLQGGTLSLDGITLTANSSGYFVITDIDSLTDGIPGSAAVAGDLVFTPALNDSNYTTSWTFDITMNIATGTSPISINEIFSYSVTSVADIPQWEANSGTNYQFFIDEDSSELLNPGVAILQDTDGSEELSYKVSLISDGLMLSSGGSFINDGDILTDSQYGALTASAEADLSGSFFYVVEAIATEKENNDQALSVGQMFSVNVQGVADQPELFVRNIKGSEDVPIELSQVLLGSLSDTDGSESLWFELTLPEGWDVDAPSRQDLGSGVFRVSGADVQSGATLIPKEDISQVTEITTISAQAVAIEASVDGVAPAVVEAVSEILDFTVTLKGVVDLPDITTGDGDWSFDAGAGVISSNVTFSEDTRVPLNFGIQTEDDDGSESISLLLSGLPEGSRLFDSGGNEVFLEVFDVSDSNNVVYSVTRAQLSALEFEPPPDFSGNISLDLEQINTEPDGDSESFSLSIQFTIVPVVDTAGNQALEGIGVEDSARPLNFLPVLEDLDGSETVSEFTLLQGFSGSLYLDGVLLDFSSGSVSLSGSAGGDLEGLLRSGRITYQAPEDQHGDFEIDFSYEITDSNDNAAQDDVQVFSGTMIVDVYAQVEQFQPTTDDDTRLETSSSTLVSTGGAPIDLTGQVEFFEEDLDGSETLDYILLKMPSATGWYVDAPGAIHDGLGNWLIPAPSTSTSVMEQALSVLDGVLVYSQGAYSGIIQVEARVIDGVTDDADIILGTLAVDFQGTGNSTVAFSPNDIQVTIADGIEGQDTTFAGHLNTDLVNAGDDAGADQISIRVTPEDMILAGIAGASLTGAGVRVHYDLDGTTVLAWIFDEPALATLGLSGVDEDLSGDIQLPVHIVVTDPSGDTIEDEQLLIVDLLPVVDELNPVPVYEGNEDQLFNLGFKLENFLGDDDILPGRGIESVTGITFSNLSGGTIFDPENVLIEVSPGVYTVNDIEDREKVYYRPPRHQDGSFSLDITLEITDSTTGSTVQPNQVTESKTFSYILELDPVTDKARLTVPDDPIVGDEDSAIDLSALGAELIDQDGSEAMSLQITGVPQGAVVYANGVQLPNNGLDGSGVTYSWSVTIDQLDSLTIVPPEDFAGDITMTLEAVTYELGTSDFVTTTVDFTVGVNPIADGVQLLNVPAQAEGVEGEPVNLNVIAEILEQVNPNEFLSVTVTTLSTSDATALEGLERIEVGSNRARFINNGDGTFSASLLVAASALGVASGGGTGIDLFTGELAWGDLDLEVAVASVDRATVLGNLATDRSVAETATLTVSLTAAPDPALIELEYDGIIASNGQNLGLGIALDPQNVAPGETSELIISGLPEGFSFNVGQAEGVNWVVGEADIGNLELQTADQTGIFTLSLQTRTSLGGETVTGNLNSLAINIQNSGDSVLVGTSGDDYYSGLSGADVFTWSAGDQGNFLRPANDRVVDFSVSDLDQLDLSGLLSADASSTGTELDALIDVSESGGSTSFSISVGSTLSVNQVISLDAVSKDNLYGGDSSGVSEADFLQKLVDDNILITV